MMNYLEHFKEALNTVRTDEFSEYPGNVSEVIATTVSELQFEFKQILFHNPIGFNSYHEAYGILMEEIDELWEIIKQKESERDYERLEEEAIQVAAIALAIALAHTIKK